MLAVYLQQITLQLILVLMRSYKMYKLIKHPNTGEIFSVSKQDGNILLCIPFNPDNTDYQTFKKDLANGAELRDADGNVMTLADTKAFIATLP